MQKRWRRVGSVWWAGEGLERIDASVMAWRVEVLDTLCCVVSMAE